MEVTETAAEPEEPPSELARQGTGTALRDTRRHAQERETSADTDECPRVRAGGRKQERHCEGGGVERHRNAIKLS